MSARHRDRAFVDFRSGVAITAMRNYLGDSLIMTTSLAGLFRRLFPALVAGLFLVVLGGAGLYYAATGFALTSAVLAITGTAAIIALFGLVALQIENNALLHRIARATEVRPVEARQSGNVVSVGAGAAVEPVASALVARRGQIETPARAVPAGARGRVEPAVTIRPAASSPQG